MNEVKTNNLEMRLSTPTIDVSINVDFDNGISTKDVAEALQMVASRHFIFLNEKKSTERGASSDV